MIKQPMLKSRENYKKNKNALLNYKENKKTSLFMNKK